VREATLLVTGASGFLGRHLAAEALRAWPGRVRLLRHARPLPSDLPARLECVPGDLEDEASLARACEGVAAVAHAACHIGDDPRRCHSVNALGTLALVASARRAGVERLAYLSTTAVYGWAVHAGAREDEVAVAPATPVSRSRAEAESAVLDAGGLVLRPTFVYGAGDGRFVPAVLGALRRLPFLVGGGRARLSVVAADDLARLAVALLSPAGAPVRGVYHANDLAPISFLSIARTLSRHLGTPVPRLSVPYALARWIVRAAASGPWSPSAEHRVFLVTHDHHYDGAAAWRKAALAPGLPFEERLREFVPWYRRFVPGAPAELAA
jgi:nucleoside-diphosphate-sugar epimerase